jgi:hypothetical protein
MGPAYRETADAVMAVLRGHTLRELEQLYRPNTTPSRPEPRRLAAEAPRPETEAAATLARECTDHAAVILWCADRVRAVDGGEAVRDAADYLHDLSTRAQVDTTSAPNRPAIIRECAQAIHSMGGDGDVERAAEYLDDLATEAEEDEDCPTHSTPAITDEQ